MSMTVIITNDCGSEEDKYTTPYNTMNQKGTIYPKKFT